MKRESYFLLILATIMLISCWPYKHFKTNKSNVNTKRLNSKLDINAVDINTEKNYVDKSELNAYLSKEICTNIVDCNNNNVNSILSISFSSDLKQNLDPAAVGCVTAFSLFLIGWPFEIDRVNSNIKATIKDKYGATIKEYEANATKRACVAFFWGTTFDDVCEKAINKSFNKSFRNIESQIQTDFNYLNNQIETKSKEFDNEEMNFVFKNFNDIDSYKSVHPNSLFIDEILKRSYNNFPVENLPKLISIFPSSKSIPEIESKYIKSQTSLTSIIGAYNLYPKPSLTNDEIGKIACSTIQNFKDVEIFHKKFPQAIFDHDLESKAQKLITGFDDCLSFKNIFKYSTFKIDSVAIPYVTNFDKYMVFSTNFTNSDYKTTAGNKACEYFNSFAEFNKIIENLPEFTFDNNTLLKALNVTNSIDDIVKLKERFPNIAQNDIENRIYYFTENESDIVKLESICAFYTTNYPKGSYVKKINALPEKLCYQTAKSGNFNDLEVYLETYPTGLHFKEINALRENTYYLTAKSGSTDDCQTYLDKYPNGLHFKEIKGLQEILYYQAAKSGSISDCEFFLSKYPTSKYKLEIQNLNTTKKEQRDREELDKKEQSGTFVDSRDGHSYGYKKYGNTIWMTENLAYNAGSGCFAYNNNEDLVGKYGRFYQYNQRLKNVCPVGWRVPSENDWNNLVNFLGGPELAGKKMKSTTDWYSGGLFGKSYEQGTNLSGFNALPYGNYEYVPNEFYKHWFEGLGERANFWTEKGGLFYLDYRFDRIVYNSGASSFEGYSIRCVRNN